MPEKMIARRTAMPMVAAENVPIHDSCESVRGSETNQHAMAATTEKTTVQAAPPVIVFSHFAPTRQCKAIMKVLLPMKRTAVALYAHCDPPNKLRPISQTSRTSGCFKQYLHRIREVYCTIAATPMVTITPGTMPKTEKDLREAQLIRDGVVLGNQQDHIPRE